MILGFHPNPIFWRNAARNQIGNIEQIKNRWAQYFEQLLNAFPPTLEEVKNAFKMIRNNVVVVEKIPAELLTAIADILSETLYCNQAEGYHMNAFKR